MRPIVIVANSRRYGRCRSCGAHLEWATTAAGKDLPFNAPIVLLPRLLSDDDHAHVDTTRTVAHFATCPQAARWRHKGR